jgi:S-layer homology domain.
MKKILSLLLVIALLCSGMTAMAATTDVNEMVTLLSQLNILNGDGNGNFRLDDNVSRAEFAKVAIASSSYKNSVSSTLKLSPFTDVPYTYWGAGYIKVAAENGICKGFPNATFKPDSQVKYEEAITMMLKVLGYTDADFKDAYPSGQVSLAKSLGLTDGIGKSVGGALTRRDVVRLIYNALDTKIKNTSNKLISIFDCTVVEDVTIIATSNESSTLASDKIATTSGNYSISDSFDKSVVGKKGSLIVENGDTAIAFVASSGEGLKKYVVYSLISDGVVVYNNGNMQQITITDGTVAYNEDNAKSTYGSIKSNLSMGDTIYVAYSASGAIDYISYGDGSLVGPITVSNSSWLSELSGLNGSATIVRNGTKVSEDSVAINDIVYYSKELNMVFDYSSKVTGVYESASPNKDAPTSVVVSDVTYQIEGVTAFSKLSSSGSVNLGDTVTLLLGKDGKIADVVTSDSANSVVYGYLYGTGLKEYKADNQSYTAYYAKVATADGQTQEYRTDKNYDSCVDSIVSVTLEKGLGKVSIISAGSTLSGEFDWSKKKLGTSNLDSSVNILDVTSSQISRTGNYSKVFGQRLNGLNLKKGDVLFATTNSAGNITSLILNDVTGDCYKYGVIMTAKSSTDISASGQYSYDIGGTQKSFSTNGISYGNISSGDPAKFLISVDGTLANIDALTKIDTPINSVTQDSVKVGGTTYLLSDKVVVYYRDYDYDYTILSLSNIINGNKYVLHAYYDKPADEGGRVRVIVATNE